MPEGNPRYADVWHSELDIDDGFISEVFANGATYAFHRASLEKHGTIYGERCAAYVMTPEDSVNVDSPEDLELAEMRLAERNGGGPAS